MTAPTTGLKSYICVSSGSAGLEALDSTRYADSAKLGCWADG